MHVDIGAARSRHHEAKALLLVEELDVAVAPRPGRPPRAPAHPTWAAPRLHFGRGEIDAVYGRYLHPALSLRDIAVYRCALRKVGRREIRQRRSMAEGVRTIVQGYEPKTLRRIEPLHLRSLRPEAGARTK